MADSLVAGSFDAVGVVASSLDYAWVGPAAALRVEVPLRGDVGHDRGAEVFPLVRGERPPGEEILVRAAAVRLFLERASAARSGRDMAVAPAVARICHDLYGLSAGDRTRRRAVSRHQALMAAVGWSCELLPEPEAGVPRTAGVR